MDESMRYAVVLRWVEQLESEMAALEDQIERMGDIPLPELLPRIRSLEKRSAAARKELRRLEELLGYDKPVE